MTVTGVCLPMTSMLDVINQTWFPNGRRDLTKMFCSFFTIFINTQNLS